MRFKNTRNSAIELLKIIAIFMVVISHSLPVKEIEGVNGYINFEASTTNIQEFILIVFNHLGQLATALFVICSAWFLVDSKELRAKKAIGIQFDSLVISLIMLVVFCLWGGAEISKYHIFISLFPTLFGNKWFVTCYIIYYLAHTLLNKTIVALKKEELRNVCLAMFVVYSILQSIFTNKLYYNELVGFICIHYFIAYIKAYMPKYRNNKKINIICAVLAPLLLILLLCLTNVAGIYIDRFADCMRYWNHFMNPLILIWGISLFNLFSRIHIKPNNIINYISSLSLLILMIHENILVKYYLRPRIFGYIYDNYTYQYLCLWVLVLSVSTFIVSAIISSIYKLITVCIKDYYCELIYKVGTKIGRYTSNILEKIE